MKIHESLRINSQYISANNILLLMKLLPRPRQRVDVLVLVKTKT